MIFYIGDIAKGIIDDKTRLGRNKAKSWKYGYDPSIDTVIISRDGTLGEIYCVNGVNIGLPQKPADKLLVNYGKTPLNQKWDRQPMPAGLTEETVNKAQYQEYLSEEERRLDEGLWILINGFPIYLTGTYYHFVQWFREEEKYPSFRQIQNELMLFWEACKADNRCYGMDYVKNRRFGASALGENELLKSATENENKILGMISKKGTDAKKIFNRLVRAFKRLPFFLQPVFDGTTTPKTELVFSEPTKKRKSGEKIDSGEGLDTVISWHNTEMNAMDGEKIFRSLIDEAGKYPVQVPFSEYWNIVKTSHRIGSNIVGKAFVVSTVNAMKKGGAEFFKIWKGSNPLERNPNGQTKSGLYRIFIAAKYCLEGYFDQYGFSIVEDPEKPILNDLGEYRTIGAKTYLKNEADSITDPGDLNEFLRQFPDSENDAFRPESSDCAFNLTKILDQTDHNANVFDDEFREDEKYNGNKELERGNLCWKDGIQDTEVIWSPDPINGRIFIAKGCHPPLDYRNKKEKRTLNGVNAWAPLAEHIGAFGVDPYNRSKGADGRGSKGAIHLYTKTNTSDLPNETFIVEYIDRAPTVELFFEDVLMLMVYYSMPMLCEESNDKFLTMIYDRGYRHYSMNNPFKFYDELTPNQKKYGGAPPQDSKIGDAQFFAIQTYIEQYIGYSDDSSIREPGTIGYMPFNRTLLQWKDVDPDDRTKFDAYISSSLALLANQRRVRKAPEKKSWINPFKKYDNSGTISVAK